MRFPHYIHSIIKNITLNTTNKTSQPMLDRWKLKYSNDDLSLFYNQIPDPGSRIPHTGISDPGSGFPAP